MIWSLALLCSLVLGNPDSPPWHAMIITGANNHDWETTTPMLERWLRSSGSFTVSVVANPAEQLAEPTAFAKADVLVLDYNGPRWGAAAEQNFLAAVQGGVGVAVLHAANNAFPGWVEFERMVGHCWREGTGHGRFHAFDVNIHDRTHPITRDLGDLVGHPDELYHRLVHMHDAEFRLLASAYSDPQTGGTGKHEPMLMLLELGQGRVFHTPLGHIWRNAPDTHASYADPQLQALFLAGIEWAASGDVRQAKPNSLSHLEQLQGFRLLYDGENAEQWRGFRREGLPDQGWSYDGNLRVHAGGGGGDLITREKFGDFELVLDWKAAPEANSGIMFRVTEDASTTWQTGPEYQILQTGTPELDPITTAGALYGLCPAENAVLRPAGEYQRSRIVLRGQHLQHWLNGVKVVDIALDSPDYEQRRQASKFADLAGFGIAAEGHLALQDHGNDVWFRNIKIREF